MIENRSEAGKLLSEKLVKYKSDHPVVLALPRGGLPVAYEIAKSLKAPLDVFLVRKVGAPWNPEFAVGAVTINAQLINDEALNYYGLNEGELENIIAEEKEEVARRDKLYRQGKRALNVRGKTVILVDDGIATGMTAMAAIEALKQMQPEKLILAVPVLPEETFQNIRSMVDECVYIEAPREFYAVSAFYLTFPQVSDKEVLNILKRGNELEDN